MGSKRLHLAISLLFLLPFLFNNCATGRKNFPKKSGMSRRVLILGIDGIRTDAFPVAETPNLDRLIEHGCYSDQAKTGEITVSGPSWSSFLTGVWMDKHRVSDNSFKGANYEEYPHFFARLKQASPEAFTAHIVDWRPIDEHLLGPIGADFRVFQDYEERGDEKMVEAAVQVLTGHDPHVVFVYFADLDEAGHHYGFHPAAPGYISEFEEIDGQIGTILEALEGRPTFAVEDWLILVCSDHGGTIDGSHGRDVPVHRTIPFIASGPSASRGKLYNTVNIVDIPATALAHLGIEVEPSWGFDGRAVGLKKEILFRTNLIFNGDGEYSTGYKEGDKNAGIAGWTDTGAMTVVRYGASEGFPALDDQGPADRGRNFFCGGKSKESTIYQVIDVADWAGQIDNSEVIFHLSGFFGGYIDQRDLAWLTARFLDDRGGEIKVARIGPVSADERKEKSGGPREKWTGLYQKQAQGIVPRGTRRIRVTLFAEAGSGDNDGYADNLSLVLRLR